MPRGLIVQGTLDAAGRIARPAGDERIRPITPGSVHRLFTLGTLLLLGAACNRAEPVDNYAFGPPVSKTANDGPVRLTLTVRPAELAFTERAEVTVLAEAPAGVTVQLADYQAAMEEGEHRFEYRLRLVGQKRAEPTAEGTLQWEQRYELEFFVPGEYELPAAALSFVELSAPGEQAERESATGQRQLKTDPAPVTARPTQAAQIPPEELAHIKTPDPAELPDPWSWWWLSAVPLVLAATAGAVLFLRRRRREAEAAAEIIPAHEWARRQFAGLVAEDLIRRGLVQEFYYRVSGIVRGYIERRFAVSAPEMTTEEFLVATAGDYRFATGAARELQSFMTACDLVKYARQQPEAGEWDDLLRTAVGFVERTREDLPPAGASEALQREEAGAAP